jgi:hypothetical protein
VVNGCDENQTGLTGGIVSRFVTAFLMLIFANSLFAQETKPADAKPAEQAQAAPEKNANAGASASPATVGLLHVYRHKRYVGSALAPSIYIDDKQVARVGNGRRFTAKLTPGTHSVRSDDKSSLISIEVKPGQDYYIRVDEEAGMWKGHGKLTLLPAEQGRPEYTLSKPVEPDRVLAKEMVQDEK